MISEDSIFSHVNPLGIVNHGIEEPEEVLEPVEVEVEDSFVKQRYEPKQKRRPPKIEVDQGEEFYDFQP
jgi:hypothetical protein